MPDKDNTYLHIPLESTFINWVYTILIGGFVTFFIEMGAYFYQHYVVEIVIELVFFIIFAGAISAPYMWLLLILNLVLNKYKLSIKTYKRVLMTTLVLVNIGVLIAWKGFSRLSDFTFLPTFLVFLITTMIVWLIAFKSYKRKQLKID